MFRILFLMMSLFFTAVSYCSSPTYSQVVTAGQFVYVSAQVPIDPTTHLMATGDIGTLTNLVINYLQQQLATAGCTLNQVIKTKVCLADIRDYQGMDVVYGTRFNFTYPPVRDVIESEEMLNNARIQISCIADKSRH